MCKPQRVRPARTFHTNNAFKSDVDIKVPIKVPVGWQIYAPLDITALFSWRVFPVHDGNVVL